MELVDTRTQYSETQCSPSAHVPTLYSERPEVLLADLPSPPKTIIVKPSITTSDAAEFCLNATACSTSCNIITSTGVTSTTTAINATHEAIASDSPAKPPAPVFIVQQIHVSPSMAVDKWIQELWTNEIKSRLSAVLMHHIPTGTCVQELMMAGRQSNALQKSIIITCGDTSTRKRVEKTFKSQVWLRTILKAYRISFIAIVAQVALCSGPIVDSEPSETHAAYCVELTSSKPATPCGLRVLASWETEQIPASVTCTLGGLLVVDGKLVGLTAGHAFQDIERGIVQEASAESAENGEQLTQDTASFVSDVATRADSALVPYNDDDDDDDDGDNASSTASDRAYIFDSHDDQRSDGCSATSMTPTQAPYIGNDLVNRENDGSDGNSSFGHQSRGLLRFWDVILPMRAHTKLYGNDSSHKQETPVSTDWALLPTLSEALRLTQNSIFQLPTSSQTSVPTQIFIKDITTEQASGDVVIAIRDNDSLSGRLHPSLASLKVGLSMQEVQLITLEHTLCKSLNRLGVTLT